MAVSLAAMRRARDKGLELQRQGRLRRRPFARRIFGAGRRGRASASPIRRGCSRRGRGDAGGGAGRARAPWRRCSALDLGQAEELAKAAAEGEVCEAANDNAPGQVVISGRRRRSSGPSSWRRRSARRQAGDAVAGERAVPLRADAARGRRDGRGACRGDDQRRPSVPLVANVLAAPISRPRGDPVRASWSR